MISVGSRDGRKRIGLGLEMEEAELEEGEALSCNNEAQDSTIDPDIALSYIGEKLQNVLGHFQKDFEGGVSAENLGAKFGGYGSFLPTYQRSPSWSHTKSPAEAHHNHDPPKSPKRLQVEEQRRNPHASSSASPLGRPRVASVKAAAIGSSTKDNNSYLPSRPAEESSLRSGNVKKSVNSSDQRTLKVRIKVGSENLPTQKNTEIYSGLGLVVSPSSSLDDSPTTSEREFGKLTEAPEASPTSILQIMTTFPGELLLSPLSEDLTCLTEKKKPRGKFETKTVDKASIESSGMLENGSHFSKCNQKKSKLSEKGDVFSVELTNHKKNGNMDHSKGSFMKKEKETEIDTLGCEDLVSNALKLPLLSDSQNNLFEPGKVETFSSLVKDNLDNESSQAIDGVEKSSGKLSAMGKTSESKRGILVSNNSVCPSVDQSEPIVFKGRESEEGLKPAVAKPSTGSKKKQKLANSTGVQGAYSSRIDSRDLEKDHKKPTDRYKDFFGDVEFEDEDNESISGETKSPRRLKNPPVDGKRGSIDDPMSKEKIDVNISQKLPPQVLGNYLGPASQSAPPNGNGLSSEAPSGSVPLVQEDWVECDKCQKWRLLPLGTNVSSLPDKWICRMLTWLPGMNRCSVPQEETTNALRTLYNPAALIPGPTSESQHSQLNNNSAVNSMQMGKADARYPVQENQNRASQTMILNGKKKHGTVKAASSNNLDGSTYSSNSRKKGLGTSSKASKLNSGKNSPVEKYGDHKKEKPSLSNSSDRGTNLKIRSKREADMEGSRASKRIKSEELPLDDDYWTSDNGGSSSKAGRLSTSFSNNTLGNDERKYNSQTGLSGAKKDMVPGAIADTQYVPVSSVNDLLFPEKCDEKDSIRKRKAKEQNDQRKEKKARVSKSGGKDSNGSKAPVETERRSWSHKDDQLSKNAQAADYLKSDMGSVNPTVAANSSSSMVSGSHKNKSIGQEVKSSPVESVSSSPLRYPNTDKIKSNKNKEMKKDGELCGEDERGMVKNDEILNLSNPVTDVHADKYASIKNSSEQCKVEEKTSSQKKKPGKGLSSHLKDKARASGSDLGRIQNSSHESLHREHVYDERPKSRKNRSDDKSGTPSKGEKFIGKHEIAGGTPSESSKGQNQKKLVHEEKDVMKNQDKKHNVHQEQAHEKLPRKSNQAEANGNGKSHSLPPLARISTEPVSGAQKENGVKNSALDLDNGEGQKAPNQRMKAENSNGQPMRHSTPNSHKVRDIDAPSPLRRDSSSHAANSALKEAKDLKHLADRLKNTGSTETIGFYFQAALKFLHGASLLENGSNEATKHNDLMHSMHIYSSTAKLCEFCAHEYERSKDMAAASLAYKCMEVAYLRVVYSSHNSASRDRNELQTALQIVAPGESPSSSASDVDNLNHQITTDKAALPKAVGSPQVSGSHIITSRNRSGFLRILNFAQDVNFAMEASRKSRTAFTAATAKLGESSNKESLNSLKKALDFNFQDVEELLRLVRFAMDAINR
ncbi:CW-type Zinc Finger [Striga asiatica]|uniref:CW-type Zinc Finger n=1 Tax=Striga asiatica TaxID=4170 RepID=A0A5A7NWP8_STRAF|nr:CW-type Zinc Finger [Striga asiatica]